MRATRVASARWIHERLKKEQKLHADAIFDEAGVYLGDIVDGEEYYGGFAFVPSVAERYATYGLLTSAADAAHCEGKGPQSYGTFFDVLNYDQNNNLLSLAKAHSVGNENLPHWNVPFILASKIPGFDRPGRTCLVDMEKSIGASFKGCMKNATLFLDERHVVKNMSGGLGNERAVGPGALFARAAGSFEGPC
jgi:hypothetical protein